jgi:hypothetical protein
MSLDGYQIWHTLRILGGRLNDLECILLLFCLFFYDTQLPCLGAWTVQPGRVHACF